MYALFKIFALLTGTLATPVPVPQAPVAVGLANLPPGFTTYVASPGALEVVSTLFTNANEAVLFDTQFTKNETANFIAKIKDTIDTKKVNVKALFVTHAHPDHCFGINQLKEAFPGMKVYASQTTVDEIKLTKDYKLKFWGDLTGGAVPTALDLPEVYNQPTFTVGNINIDIRQVAGDVDNTIFYFPSSKTVITGDVTFSHFAPWLLDQQRLKPSATTGLQAWLKTLRDIQKWDPEHVISGHYGKDDPSRGGLPRTLEYIQYFRSLKGNPDEIKAALEKKYPAIDTNSILIQGLNAGTDTLEYFYFRIAKKIAPLDPTMTMDSYNACLKYYNSQLLDNAPPGTSTNEQYFLERCGVAPPKL